MIAELIEKQKQFIKYQKELLKLANEKSGELYKEVDKRLKDEFQKESFELMVPLTGGILADNWEPMVGFSKIAELDFHHFYYSTKEELKEMYPETIDWEKLFRVCKTLEKELGVHINITKKR